MKRQSPFRHLEPSEDERRVRCYFVIIKRTGKIVAILPKKPFEFDDKIVYIKEGWRFVNKPLVWIGKKK